MAMIADPQKKYYRQRAHSNPMSDHDLNYPNNPSDVDWTEYYAEYLGNSENCSNSKVEFLDVGCGYGGLLVSLAPMFPKTLMLGIEIRVKVSDYVRDRIEALRSRNEGHSYDNISVIRTNAMKYLPNYFTKHQLSKLFFLYPDPHFKKAKYKWRIISPTLLSEYAFFLRPGGLVYTITDVKDMHDWMVTHLSDHPLFERISDSEMNNDIVIKKLYESTEEGQKVTSNKGDKFPAVFRRLPDPPV